MATKEFFPEIGKIKFEGRDSCNPLAFRFYDPEKVVMGKKMKDWFKFAMAWWHTLCAQGTDQFGGDTKQFPWNTATDSIQAAKDKGYSVLLLDGQLDVPAIQMLEQKFEKSRFTRVDADIIDRLIVKDDAPKSTLTDDESANLSQVFRSQMPKMDKTEFMVEVQSLGENQRPVVITQNEWMRRMKEMSRFQQGMNFYGQMPDSFNLVLNADHRLVKEILSTLNSQLSTVLQPIESELKGQEARLAAINQQQSGKKADELTQDDKDMKADCEKAVQEQKDKKQEVLNGFAAQNDIIHQLIDLALLQNGMLRGEALDKFLKRSVDLIK